MNIGVLALQGAFIEHEKMLSKLGVQSFEIRQKSDIQKSMDGIIIPGGESTVMGKLLRELDIYDELKAMITKGLPVFGTCAGLILLAKKIDGEEPHLAVMDIEAKRNAYGRQLGSFAAKGDFAGREIPMVFIRAPYIPEVYGETKMLSVTDGKITAARDRNMLACSFHPELSEDTTVHEYFLDMIRSANVKKK